MHVQVTTALSPGPGLATWIGRISWWDGTGLGKYRHAPAVPCKSAGTRVWVGLIVRWRLLRGGLEFELELFASMKGSCLLRCGIRMVVGRSESGDGW